MIDFQSIIILNDLRFPAPPLGKNLWPLMTLPPGEPRTAAHPCKQ